jgi:Arc/MetJ-type ribon-helix-helix transcriptional regulator
MTRNLSPDVESLIRTMMATGRFRSENDLLLEALERLNDETVDAEEDMEAILEGLNEVDQGVAGIPIEEARRILLQNLAEDESA